MIVIAHHRAGDGIIIRRCRRPRTQCGTAIRAAAGCTERAELPFHKMLLEDKLPLSIGGGIGQSRLCMLMMGSAHIGEVQCSVWDEHTREACAAAGIRLL